LTPPPWPFISLRNRRRGFAAAFISTPEIGGCSSAPYLNGRTMANTSSARKATRVIARRTEVNIARRSRMRTAVRKAEEAIKAGNKDAALAAIKSAAPEIMRAAQKGVIHRNAANRKVSRLAHAAAKIGK
jgi:small subunit ribosomal protein S20